MRIILFTDIKGVGRKNDIVNVSDGYGLNFVLPKKLGARATPAEITRHEARIKAESAEILRLQAIVKKLSKDPLIMKLKTGAKGVVFDSLTKNDVCKALVVKGYTDVKTVDIAKPIRTAGEHQGTAHFGHGIEATFTIMTSVDK